MEHVCPWWLAVAIDNPLRMLLHDPRRLFGPHVRPGMSALDVGCGRGFATIGLARLVGRSGKVVAVDVQPRMLEMTERRLQRAGLHDRVALRCATVDDLPLGDGERFHFANAFWMVHEVPDRTALLAGIRRHLTPGGLLLVAEPWVHVTGTAFAAMLRTAAEVGLEVVGRPKVAVSHAALLRRPAAAA